MAKEVWFRRGDGVEFASSEGTVAFDMMSKDGAFVRIDGPGAKPATAPVKQEGEDLSKLTVKQLQERAALLDVPLTKEMKKAEIIAAIQEKVPAEE